MAYSTVVTPPLRVKRRSERPLVDGESVIQELGYSEIKVYRFFWITTAELQAEIESLELEASNGWVIVGEPSRVPVHDALDLYNAQVTMHRFVPLPLTTTTTTTAP